MEMSALETTFYTMGIILMSFIVILMLISVVMIFYIKHRLNVIQKTIEGKIKDIAERPQDFAFDIGSSLMSKIFSARKRR